MKTDIFLPENISRSISKTRELLNGMFCNLSGQQVSNG